MFNYNLVIIGTGIRTVGQLTTESIAWMKKAEKLYYVVGDPIGEEVIKELNPKGAQTLTDLYGEGKDRIDTYNEMIATIMKSVREGHMTVGAFYGHPGVFAYPSHESVRIAKEEGYKAVMLPGISAEDCLFADLGVDPAKSGCQSYEATDFLANSRIIDNSSQVILWQIGVLGDWTFKKTAYDTSAMPLLVEKLCTYYPPEHLVTIYEASIFIGFDPIVKKVPIYQLPYSALNSASTLYIPPCRETVPDPRYVFRMKMPVAK
ncbi:MAG: SAM-dependent methyltransferase [Chitinophagaceae bacterium]